MNNSTLFDLETTGASLRTAQPDGLAVVGVAASNALAEADRARIRQYKGRFDAAGAAHDLPPALLAGIASRESRGGAVLDADGWGDHRNAYGIMQIDKRSFTIAGVGDRGSQAHIDQAAGILQSNVRQVRAKHADWPEARQLQGAVAAYNFGVGNVQTIAGIDKGTTHDDYSNDVWARARYYAAHWDTI